MGKNGIYDYDFAGYIDLESRDYPLMPEGLCYIPRAYTKTLELKSDPIGDTYIFGHRLPYIPDKHYVLVTNPFVFALTRDGEMVTPIWKRFIVDEDREKTIGAVYDREHGRGGPIRLMVYGTDHGMSIEDAERLQGSISWAIMRAKLADKIPKIGGFEEERE